MPTPYPRPGTRPVVHYVPVDEASLSPYGPYELAVRQAVIQAEQRRLHAQWKIRHDEREARDRANRRVMWRVVIGAAVVVLAVVGFAVWELTRVVAAHATGILGVVALVIAACVLVPVLVGGGCKTVITVWHSHR